nr:unnamed protein product [Callosobruchus analis]
MSITITSETHELQEKLERIRNCQAALDAEILALKAKQYCLIRVKPR